MAGRIYVASFQNVSVAAVQDLFSLKSSAGKGLEIHHIKLTAGGVTAAAELRVRLKRLTGTLTAGSAGTSGTANVIDATNSTAATATVRQNDTTQASATTSVTLWEEQWNVLMPMEHMPAPEDREVIDVNSQFVLDIAATPGASTLVSGYIKWEEYP